MNKKFLWTFFLAALVEITGGGTSLNAVATPKDDAKAQSKIKKPAGPPPEMTRSISLSSACQAAVGGEACSYFTNGSSEWGQNCGDMVGLSDSCLQNVYMNNETGKATCNADYQKWINWEGHTSGTGAGGWITCAAGPQNTPCADYMILCVYQPLLKKSP